jgi:hypothetical protein
MNHQKLAELKFAEIVALGKGVTEVQVGDYIVDVIHRAEIIIDSPNIDYKFITQRYAFYVYLGRVDSICETTIHFKKIRAFLNGIETAAIGFGATELSSLETSASDRICDHLQLLGT